MITKVEDLFVWQKSRILVHEVYLIIKLFPDYEKFNLTDQLRRATVSVPSNIAEGFGRFHYQESINFYRIARGSLIEVRSHLLLASDQNYFPQEQLNTLLDLLDEIGKMLNSLINKTKEVRVAKQSSKL